MEVSDAEMGSLYLEEPERVCLHEGTRKGLFAWSQKRPTCTERPWERLQARSIDTDLPRRKSHKGFIYKEIPKEWFQNRSFTQKY